MKIKNNILRVSLSKKYNEEYDYDQIIVNCSINGRSYQFSEYCELETFLLDENRKSANNMLYISLKEFKKERNIDPYYYHNEGYFNYLKNAKKYYSIDYLDSCSCGVPGCDGILNGVKIAKERGFIHYSVNKKAGYVNGILGTKLYKVKVPMEDILKIREFLKTEVEQESNKND